MTFTEADTFEQMILDRVAPKSQPPCHNAPPRKMSVPFLVALSFKRAAERLPHALDPFIFTIFLILALNA